MADKTWVSTDGNLNAAGSFSPSGVLASGDSLFFDGSVQTDVSSGLTQPSTFDMVTVWTQRAYEGDVGAHGNPLTCQAKRIIVQGAGSFYHAYQTPIVDNGTYVAVDSRNMQDAYTLTSTETATGLGLWCVSGAATILDAVTHINSIFVAPRGPGVRLTIGSGITTNLNYYQCGGFVTTKSPLGSADRFAHLAGGTLVYDRAATSTWTAVTIKSGGRFVYNGSGQLTLAIVEANGILDMTQDSRAKTISILYLMPGANFLTHNNITVSSTVDLRGQVPILP